MYKVKVVKKHSSVTIKADNGRKIVTLKSGNEVTLDKKVIDICNKNLVSLMQLKVITVRKIAENKVPNKPKNVNDKKVNKKRPRVTK